MKALLLAGLFLIQAPAKDLDPVGTWKMELLVNEAVLKKQGSSAQDQFRAQAADFNRTESWIVFRKDRTYVIPPEKKPGPNQEEGKWSVKGLTLTLQAKKQLGKTVAKKKMQRFKFMQDGKTIYLDLTPELRLVYRNKT